MAIAILSPANHLYMSQVNGYCDIVPLLGFDLTSSDSIIKIGFEFMCAEK